MLQKTQGALRRCSELNICGVKTVGHHSRRQFPFRLAAPLSGEKRFYSDKMFSWKLYVTPPCLQSVFLQWEKLFWNQSVLSHRLFLRLCLFRLDPPLLWIFVNSLSSWKQKLCILGWWVAAESHNWKWRANICCNSDFSKEEPPDWALCR